MMVFSASRREDMPAFPFRMEALLRKYTQYNDAFWVLWTKNPELLPESKMDFSKVALNLTVTGLGSTSTEPNIPPPPFVWDHTERLIARGLLPSLINWRLDPLFPTIPEQDLSRIEEMAYCAASLGITRCVVSFPTPYPHVLRRWPEMSSLIPDKDEQRFHALRIRGILARRGIQLFGCSQPVLRDIALPSKCIDGSYYRRVTGLTFSAVKDGGQRSSCGCTTSIDIGGYNECVAGCRYCYATGREKESLQLTLTQ